MKQPQKMTRQERNVARKRNNEIRKAKAQAKAEARQDIRNSRTAKQQIALLDERGVDAERERDRLWEKKGKQ